MKPIRIGIIGTGNISHVHMNAYKQNPRVELYALCDLNRERVLAAAKAYGVPEGNAEAAGARRGERLYLE